MLFLQCFYIPLSKHFQHFLNKCSFVCNAPVSVVYASFTHCSNSMSLSMGSVNFEVGKPMLWWSQSNDGCPGWIRNPLRRREFCKLVWLWGELGVRRRVAVDGARAVARRLLTVLEQRLTVLLRNCGSAAPSSSPITGCAMTFRPDTDKADGCVAHLWIYFCSDTDTDK